MFFLDEVADTPTSGQVPLLRRRLSPAVLKVARSSALLLIAAELFVYFRWLPKWLDMRLASASRAESTFGGGWPYEATIWAAAVLGVIAMSAWCALAFLILWRRSRDLFGLLLAVGFASAGVIESTDVAAIISMHTRNAGRWGAAWGSWSAIVSALVLYIANTLAILWVYLFPDGRFAPRASAAFAGGWIAWNITLFGLYLATFWPDWLRWDVVSVAFVVALVAMLVIRYRRHSDQIQRAQIRWLVGGAFLVAVGYIAIRLVLGIPSLRASVPGFFVRLAGHVIMSFGLIAIPLAMFFAIFRQGLLEVDYWINRTIFYAALTAIAIATFLLAYAGLGRLMEIVFGRVSELLIPFLAIPLAFGLLLLRSRFGAVLDRFTSERVVLTIMFMDMVDSTGHAVRLGDEAWRSLIGNYRATVRDHLERYGGDEVDTAGDGFFATFAEPRTAVHFAMDLIPALKRLGISVRIGIHTGEVSRYGVGVTGVAVHIAARVMSAAAADQVLVSAKVRDLLARSRLELHDGGEHQLKGVPGRMRLYSVET